MKSLFSVLLLTLASSILAQSSFRDGYIVTNKDETLYGEVEYRTDDKNYRSCLFKSQEGEITEYYPQKDLKGYGFVGDKYFSAEIRDGFFVEALIDGALSLYKFNEIFYLKKDTSIFLLATKIEEITINSNKVIKESSNWKGLTSYLIGDCQSTINIQNLKFEENSLVKVIIRYNECKGNDFIVFKESKPFAFLRFGASLSVVNSTIRTQSHPQPFSSTIEYMDDSYSSIDPVIGIAFIAASPRTSENVTFHSGINFIKSNYSTLYIRKEAQQTEYHESYINLTTFNIPAYLKFAFPTRAVTFSILAGGGLDINTKSYTRVFSEAVVGNPSERVVVTYPDMEAFEVKQSQIGTMIGIGMQKEFRDFLLSTTIKYIRMSTLSESPGLEVKISRISYGLTITKR
jgi:hypothetical protein